MTRVRWWVHAARLWLARRITPRTHRVCDAAHLARADEFAADLWYYTHRSGHLTRGFKAGRRLRADLHGLLQRLRAA